MACEKSVTPTAFERPYGLDRGARIPYNGNAPSRDSCETLL